MGLCVRGRQSTVGSTPTWLCARRWKGETTEGHRCEPLLPNPALLIVNVAWWWWFEYMLASSDDFFVAPIQHVMPRIQSHNSTIT
jgi:hypothetical protein